MGYKLILTDRETGETLEFEFATRAERMGKAFDFDVHKYKWRMVDPLDSFDVTDDVLADLEALKQID